MGSLRAERNCFALLVNRKSELARSCLYFSGKKKYFYSSKQSKFARACAFVHVNNSRSRTIPGSCRRLNISPGQRSKIPIPS